MDIKQAKNAFRQNKPPAGKAHGSKKGKKGYDRQQLKQDLRTDSEIAADRVFDRDQDDRWQRAKHMTKGQSGEVTQVNERGFYHMKPGSFIPDFVAWPKSKVAEAGGIGRVA